MTAGTVVLLIYGGFALLVLGVICYQVGRSRGLLEGYIQRIHEEEE